MAGYLSDSDPTYYVGDKDISVEGWVQLAQLNWELAEAYLKDAQEQLQVVRDRLKQALEIKEEWESGYDQ